MAKRRLKRKFSWYLIWFFIVVFFLILFFLLSATLPIWQIEHLDINGTKFVDKDLVYDTARYALGENIFLVKTRPILKELLEEPLIKDVVVNKRYPNTLEINVLERVETAVAIMEEKIVLFDDDGVILNPDSSDTITPKSDLTVVVGVKNEDIQNGKLDQEIKKYLSGILKDLKDYLPHERVKVDISEGNNIVLLVDDFIFLKVGEAQNMNKKLKTFLQLRDFEQERLQSIEYIDVRVPQNPVIKFK